MAAMDARFSVAIEDVQKIAIPVLRHRIQHQFPSPGRRHDERRHHRAFDSRDASAGDSEV